MASMVTAFRLVAALHFVAAFHFAVCTLFTAAAFCLRRRRRVGGLRCNRRQQRECKCECLHVHRSAFRFHCPRLASHASIPAISFFCATMISCASARDVGALPLGNTVAISKLPREMIRQPDINIRPCDIIAVRHIYPPHHVPKRQSIVEQHPCLGGVRTSKQSRHRSNACKLQTERITNFEFATTEDHRPFLRQVADDYLMTISFYHYHGRGQRVDARTACAFFLVAKICQDRLSLDRVMKFYPDGFIADPSHASAEKFIPAQT